MESSYHTACLYQSQLNISLFYLFFLMDFMLVKDVRLTDLNNEILSAHRAGTAWPMIGQTSPTL